MKPRRSRRVASNKGKGKGKSKAAIKPLPCFVNDSSLLRCVVISRTRRIAVLRVVRAEWEFLLRAVVTVCFLGSRHLLGTREGGAHTFAGVTPASCWLSHPSLVAGTVRGEPKRESDLGAGCVHPAPASRIKQNIRDWLALLAAEAGGQRWCDRHLVYSKDSGGYAYVEFDLLAAIEREENKQSSSWIKATGRAQVCGLPLCGIALSCPALPCCAMLCPHHPAATGSVHAAGAVAPRAPGPARFDHLHEGRLQRRVGGMGRLSVGAVGSPASPGPTRAGFYPLSLPLDAACRSDCRPLSERRPPLSRFRCPAHVRVQGSDVRRPLAPFAGSARAQHGQRVPAPSVSRAARQGVRVRRSFGRQWRRHGEWMEGAG